MILITIYLVGVKNTDSWRAMKRDLQRAFSLDVSMDPSSALTVSTNGECFTCSGFSLGETGCLGSLKFIIDCFGSLSLSPRRSDSEAPFMGSTHSGSPSPLWAMTEDSTDEFHMASSGEAASGLPTPRRCDTGAPPAPITATSWLENAPATHAITTVPPRAPTPRPDIGLPFERWYTFWEGQRARAHAQQLNTKHGASQRQDRLTGKQATAAA
jgi:hypothetical protein